MPTDAELFKKYGVDPSKYRLDKEAGEFVPLEEASGAGVDTDIHPADVADEGIGGTIARRAAGSFIPTMASLPVMAKAAQFGSKVPGGPLMKGAGALGAGLLAGGVTGWGVGKAQHALAEGLDPDLTAGWNQQEKINAEANPKSDIVGGIAPMLVSNKANGLKNAAEFAKAFFNPVDMDPSMAAKGAQVALNSGLGAVQEAVHEFDTSKPLFGLKPGNIMTAAAGYAMFGDFRKPMAKLLTKAGIPMHGDTPSIPEQMRKTPDKPGVGVKAAATVPESGATIDQQFKDAIDPRTSRMAVFIPKETVYKGKVPEGLVPVQRPDGVMYVNEQKGGSVQKAATASEAPATELGMSQDTKPAGGDTVVTGQKNGVETTSEVVDGSDPAAVEKAAEAAAKASPDAEVTVKDPAEVIAERVQKTGEETPEDLNAQLEEESTKWQPSSDKANPSDKPKISQAWYDLWKKLGFDKYGVTTDSEPKITTDTGAPARGEYDPMNRAVGVDTKRATPDTQPHEIFHAFIQDTLTHGTEGEKAFIKKAIEAHEGLKNSKGEAIDAEEALTQATGEHLVGRRDKKNDRLLSDMVAFLRYKMGRATRGDMQRLASGAMARGRGFREQALGETPTTGGIRHQPDDSEEFEGGADVEKLISILRNKQDRGNVAHVAGRELIQNSIDALKQSGNDAPTIAFGTNDDNGTMMMVDNAGGMSPKFIVTKFLKMGYSSKGIGNGGGFGIAKGQFLGNSDKFEIRSLWTDPTTKQRWLTKVVGDGQSFTKAQKPFKAKFTPNEEHVVPGGLRYTIEDVTGKHETTEDGTSVHLTYPKTPGGLYDARSAVKKSLRYNGDIKGVHLGDETRYDNDSPLTNGSGYGTHDVIRNMDDDLGMDYNYDTRTSEKPSYLKHDTITAKGSNIDIFSKKGSPVNTGRWFHIPVLSNGIHQFDLSLSLPEAIAMPEMSVNIRPTVEGQHKDYPFAIDRSSVSDDVANTIKQYFMDMGKREMNRRIDAFSAAKDRAPRMKIPGTEKYSLLDTAQKIPAELIDQIAKSPEMATVAHTLSNIHNVVRKTLGRRFPGQNLENADFRGMFMGTENAYGIRFGKDASDSPGEVYYDPLLLWKKATDDAGENATPDEVMSRWLGQTVGVALHENLHQKIHEEGEALARELTFTSGEIAMAKDSIISAIEANLDTIINNPKIHDTLKHFYTESKPFADSSKSGEFVSGIEAGFRMEARPNEGNKRYQEDSNGDTTEYKTPSKAKTPILSSYVDLLRRSKDPAKQSIGGALANAWNERAENQGRYENMVMPLVDKLSKDSQKRVLNHWIETQAAGVDSPIDGGSEKEQAALDAIREMLIQIREQSNEQGMMVRDREGNERKGRFDPVYMPHLIDPDVHSRLKNEQGSEWWHSIVDPYRESLIEQLRAKHQTGRKNPISDAEIESIADAKIRNITGAEPMRGGTAEWKAHSKPLRLAESTKLTPEMIDTNLPRLLEKYIAQVSKDLAFHKFVESKPEIAKLIGEVEDANPRDVLAGNSDVAGALSDYRGDNIKAKGKIEKALGSVSDLAVALLIANPVTRGTDFITTAFRGPAAAENPFQIPQVLFGMLKNVASGKAGRDARETGLIRNMANYMDNLIGNTEKIRSGTRKWASWGSKASGSEAIERGTRTMAQAYGDVLARIYVESAKNGDKTAIHHLEQIAPDGEWAQLAESDAGIARLATRIAKEFQGVYNNSNLSPHMTDGPAAPMLRMSKWSVEQANNFRKYQLDPLLKHGDAMPLAMYLAVMAGGSAAVQEFREWASGRKSYTPTWAELGEGKDGGRVTSNAIAKVTKAFEYVGVAGAYMNLANMAAQAMAGQQSQEIVSPMVQAGTDMTRRAVQGAKAIFEGQDPALVIPAMIDKMAQSQISMFRIARNWALNSRAKSIRENARDFSNFKLLQGGEKKPFLPIVSYDKMDEKEFDKADLSEAGGALRNSVRRQAFNDPSKLPKKIKDLGVIASTGEGPSLKDEEKLLEYIAFIKKTQGADRARQVYRDLIQRDAERKAKREMVGALKE